MALKHYRSPSAYSYVMAEVVESIEESDIRLIHEVGVEYLFVDAQNFSGNLEHLAGATCLKSIKLYGTRQMRDLSPLEGLVNLEDIMIGSPDKYRLDFSKFRKLRKCDLLWSREGSSVLKLNSLEDLQLRYYDADDLTDLGELSSLRSLRLMRGTLSTLRGIERLDKLQELYLFRLLNVHNTAPAESLPHLKTLYLRAMKSFRDWAGLVRLRHLNDLQIIDTPVVLDTISWVRDMPQLESLSLIGVKDILDHDLSPILELPKLKRLGIFKRRHYNYTEQELRRILGLPLLKERPKRSKSHT